MGKWLTTYATECGHEVYVLEDWDTPRFCKECKAENDAKWYDTACEDCGATIRACTEWEHAPRYCKSCKAARDAKWYDKSCEHCGKTIRANTDWEHLPKFCEDCKHEFAPKSADCDHCNTTFTIPMGTQINCKEHGWDLPKKCPDRREKFRHKPFKTVATARFPIPSPPDERPSADRQVASMLSWPEAKYAHPPDSIWRRRSSSVVEEMLCGRALGFISSPSETPSWFSIFIFLRTRLVVPRDGGTHR